jgi:acyl-CoA thioesterase I
MSGLRHRSLFVLAACLLAAAAQATACRSPAPAAQNEAATLDDAAPASTDPFDTAPARPTIVVLGDSLTAGLGLPESQAFPALLQQKIDEHGYEYEVENAGVSGDTSAGGLRRLDWALRGNVRVLILALGANDGLRGLSVGEMKDNLTAIIDRAEGRGAVVILAGMEAPPNYGQEYATAFRTTFRDIAQTTRVRFIPFLLDKVAGHPDLNQRDGIHPNAQGAAIVADNVWSALQPVLDSLAS